MRNDLISRSALLEKLRFAEEHGNGFGLAFPIELVEVSHAVDAVSRSVFEQIKWERDCAMQQLKDHGIPFGGIALAVDAVVVVRCKNCLHTREKNEYERNYLVDEVLICTSPDVTDDCWNPVWPNHWCSYGERRADDEVSI